MTTLLLIVGVAVLSLLLGMWIEHEPLGDHISPSRIVSISKRGLGKWSTPELVHMSRCVRCNHAVNQAEHAVANKQNWAVCVDDGGLPVVTIYNFKIPEGDTRVYNAYGQPLEWLK